MRFSLRSLFFCTALVAVVYGVFVLPRGLPVLVLPPVSLIILSAAAAGAVYAREGMRAFCIGSSVAGSWIVLYTMMFLFLSIVDGPRGLERVVEHMVGPDASQYEPLWGWKAVFAGYHVVNVLGGLAAVAVRRICLRPATRGESDGRP